MAVFDPAGGGWSDDPWPRYRALLEEAPVHRTPRGVWVLARHADCLSLLRDRGASVEGERSPDPRRGDEGRSRAFLFRDPPDHTRLRSLVASAFTPKMVSRLRHRAEEIATELLETALDRERFDAVAELAYPLPIGVICELLGVPAADHQRFCTWSRALARGIDPDYLLSDEEHRQRQEATVALAGYFADLLAERRRVPGPDLLSALLAARDRSGALAEDELLATCILLLVAGHETTVNLISGGLLALATHPAEEARLRREPETGERAVEEMARFVSPVQLTGRTLLDPMDFGGVRIRAGEAVVALLAAANRDPEVFEEPDAFRVGRADNRHLAFGFGVHHCLGAALARMETRVVVDQLLRRTHSLGLGSGPLCYRRNVVLRGLEALPLELAPA